jgi:Domain of unknown function (DUF4376)
MYQQIENSTRIKRLSDGAIIPENPTLNDWAEYQDWIKIGNTPLPVDVIPLESRRAAIWEKVKVERDRRTQNGGYKVDTKWYRSDVFSRTQQMGMVMMGANLPPNIQWKTFDGTFVLMTPTLAMQIFAAAAASDIAIFSVAESHKAAIFLSESPESYNYMSGWPLAFGE